MTDMKDFHIGDILSITTGRLVARDGIGGVYEILGYMSGEQLYTHQLCRVANEARPVLVALHPQLLEADKDAESIGRENWRQQLKLWEERFGLTLPVPKFKKDQHTEIDPITEAYNVFGPERVIVAEIAKQ